MKNIFINYSTHFSVLAFVLQPLIMLDRRSIWDH